MVGRRQLIFIVDDDQAVRDALQFSLQLEGLCVHVHSGGPALLADPNLNRARCVVIGDYMQQMDGFALLGNLHALNVSLPTIMLTSNATPRVQARANAAGVRSLLEKPLLDNDLIESIRIILSESQPEQS